MLRPLTPHPIKGATPVKVAIACITIGFLSLTSTANATLLDGKQMQLRWDYPHVGEAIEVYHFTVITGIEFDDNQGEFDSVQGKVRFDIADTLIHIFTHGPTAGWANPPGTTHNGPVFTDYTGTSDPFTSVTIASTNLPGFDSSRISFDADQIRVDLRGLVHESGSIINLDINQVPESSSFALSIVGFTALTAVWFTRRRRVRAMG